MSGFFARIGLERAKDELMDRESEYLFPLVLILQADGTLRRDAEAIYRSYQA